MTTAAARGSRRKRATWSLNDFTPATVEVERVVKSFNDHVALFRRDPRAAAVVIKGYAVAGVDPAEQAAWTLVANALLNLDEALTKE